MKTHEFPAGRSLHSKIMVFIGLLFLITVCTSSLLYIQNFRKNYLEAIEWRSVTLAQRLRVFLESRYEVFGKMADFDLILESAYLECKKLFEANRRMHVAFVCVLDENGNIVTHNDKRFWKKKFEYPKLRSTLKSKKIHTILLDDTYHTLIPVVPQDSVLLGTIDVGFPRNVVDRKLMDAIGNAAVLFFVLFVTAFIMAWFFVRQIVIHPIDRLIQATSNIAQGDLTQEIDVSSTKEFKDLALSLGRMRDAIRQSMADLEQKNQEVSALIACSPVALFSLDLSGSVAIWTASAERLFGWQAEEVAGGPLPTILHEDRDKFESLWRRVCQGEVVMGLEIHQKRRDGSSFFGSLSAAPIWAADRTIAGVMGTVEDVSERIEREKAHQKVQEQLLQAQKMESVGRLAGGVAHDYNNTLGVILGYAELMRDSLAPDNPKYENLQQIIKATRSSADITRQLLAFARKQTIAPKVLDLNKQVENMLKMLRRLIGENIELEWIPQADPGMVKMDTSQIDQILANLCVNARDAIEDTGKIIIGTRSMTVDEDYCRNHPEFRPGDFVCLTVSDTGSGMDEKTLENIFEPFFTTKGQGEGTGLGLSTVYGIVKQNNGFVNVYSEPGKGTTFNIFLSRHWGEVPQENERGLTGTTGGKGETVLLVEDDADILEITKQMLEISGYRVICSQNPEEAIARARENKERLKLLLTDVIMPTMNGRELSSRMKPFCPDLKILYMSGYTSNVIAYQGVLDDGVHFIQKPFSKRDLEKKVRSVLDA